MYIQLKPFYENLSKICLLFQSIKSITLSIPPPPSPSLLIFHSEEKMLSASLDVVVLSLCQQIPDFLSSKYRSYNPKWCNQNKLREGVNPVVMHLKFNIE